MLEELSRAEQLAWAAGFIDGEGTIIISHRNHHVYWVILTAAQKIRGPLDELARILGGVVRQGKHGTYRGAQQFSFRWGLAAYKASVAIQQVLPYLINKRPMALLALELQARLEQSHKLRPRHLSDAEVAVREMLRQNISRLNHYD